MVSPPSPRPGAASPHPEPAPGDRARVVEALCDPALAGVVDLVAYPDGSGGERSVIVANADGASRLRPGEPAELLHGRDPVERTDPMAFLPYAVEVADPSPPNARNAYPYPAERLLSFFADPRAPDVAVVRTGAHWLAGGGHAGEHGSLDAVQSRAPLLLSGAGIRARGVLARHARVVDVAPTLAHLAGVSPDRLADLDGRPLADLTGSGARWVVGLLWDGPNCGDLLQLAGSGALPQVARLLANGCALEGGAVAEFPSVTLTNHTSALTGVGTGRHGVVGNVYWDRDTGERVVPNDATTWHRSSEWLRPGVRTAFEMVAEARPGAVSASVNEPVDRGAAYSTMALIREQAGDAGADAMASMLPDPMASAYATRAHVAADPGYAWSTQVDDMGLSQTLALWERPETAPLLTWWNVTLPDSGHHAGGPRSRIARDALRDSDRRLGVFLDHLERLGVLDEVAIVLTADHGSEAADPACRGEWGTALQRTGVAVRDEGPGFLYLPR